MLLISTRLGLIACRYLAAAYYEGDWKTAPEIAAHYKINVRSLTPALQGLTRAGILMSRVGGHNPGFVFAKPPNEIMLSEVLSALQKKATLICCKELIPGLNCDCNDKTECKIFSLFDSITSDVSEKLSAVSIAEYSGITPK